MALLANDRSMGLFDWQETGPQRLAEPPPSTDSTIWQACLLALVGGYADAVGFLTFGAFAGAMTGNAVLLGIALAGHKVAEAIQSTGIIVAFLVGVAASASLRRFTTLAGLLFLEMAAIILAALVTSLAAATTLAFAMGLQSAAMTHFAGRNVSSTVFLTGNLQQFVQTLLQPGARENRAGENKTVVLVGALGVFYLAGAIAGAVAWHLTKHPLLFALVPLGLVLLRRSTWQSEG